MKQTILDLIRKWQLESGNLLFQDKKYKFDKHPAISDEYLITFSIELKTCLCDGVVIPIKLVSEVFQTTTLSDSSLNNSNIYLLENFLKDFDKQFQDFVIQKVSECKGVSTTTDPLHMK